MTTKYWKCTDGMVEKTISASSARSAAETYALVECDVQVTPVDADGNEIGETTTVHVACTR